jgi:hypothetical protein
LLVVEIQYVIVFEKCLPKFIFHINSPISAHCHSHHQYHQDVNEKNVQNCTDFHPLEYFTYQHEKDHRHMIESQSLVVKVNSIAVRFPHPNKHQVNDIDSNDDFHTKSLKLLDQHSQHDQDFHNQKVQKVKKNVPWLIIWPIWIILIMRKLLNHRLGDSLFFSLC